MASVTGTPLRRRVAPSSSHTSVSAAPGYAIADDVRRVVRNLLDNAVAHARTKVVLTVATSDGDPRGESAQLAVADDGPGIPAEARNRVFDRFYRAQASRTRSSGSGLGLAIARGLAERNGGRLDLVNADRGTTMRLLLPTGPVPGRPT